MNHKPLKLIEDLETAVAPARVLTDSDSLQQYGRDWTRFHTPAPLAIVLPSSVEEVQAVVRFARENQIGLVPSGGRTGLSASAVATNGEIVVAFDRMKKISNFNPIDRTVVCEPGVITEQLQQFAEEKDLFYPVDFASSGSSQIGGNIATNAGGIKVIRYGMTRDWVVGLKVVTGTGELLELNGGLVKNNTGYDLRQLFIGGEGTLGFIVEATMKLTRPPENLTALMLGAEDMNGVMSILKAFQQKVDLTAFEFFSEQALSRVVEHSQVQRPFDTPTPFYALLEFENTSEAISDTVMELFEHCMEQGWVLDGVMSQSISQLQNLWACREFISETITRWTPYKNDISVVVSKVPEFLAEIDNVVNREYPEFEIIWFGHIGDGNLHLNILKPDSLSTEEFLQKCNHVSKWVFEIVQEYVGSISAEHGVGLLKKDYLTYTRSEAEIDLMRGIKKVFDPDGIMNPGKIFD
ncbi:FAD-binding oxidoreductase [Sansalvadorimonas sp. 2012CJ34-2]|uniref:FAD-binding oxidoreductase n=1 Tax=Parendozoicomonas callyspongiae TaxID=2942213 RepID=A0ABT0PAV9_9GAMM|nr:FAD-binding oxidoreductase [Sansalvadorimonas sp. 2012CJ34-2]MCL6268403.1 FAD-binding oxidoreductase [Sansalvadorimonas sp. 2012CJ34-2]